MEYKLHSYFCSPKKYREEYFLEIQLSSLFLIVKNVQRLTFQYKERLHMKLK